MRIAMVSEHASPLAPIGGVDAGGQNVHVAELSAALGERGHDVVVYTRRDSPSLPGRVRMCERVLVEHLDAGPPQPVAKDELPAFVPELGSELSARLHREQPDVVHAHFWMSGLAALAATARTSIPVVQTFHALGSVKRRYQGAADTSPVNRVRCERRLATDATRLLASSTDERRELLRMGAQDAHIDVVPSGVDLTLFGPRGPRWERDAPHRLLVIARLVPRKGIDDAIRVTAGLPDTELLVAGGAEHGDIDDDLESGRLRQLADELGAGDRVRLLGSVARAELAALIRSSDAVLCLPWYEPFGIVPLEAMACGVPVVASAVGGLLDTVVDGVTGVHVPPRDPAAALPAVRALLDDERRRSELGRNGTLRATDYDWSEIAACVENSYLAAALPETQRQHEEVAG